jgi:hypothetical protein
MLFLALSCLQGREMLSAAQDLIELEIDGLQLTPGNAPSPGFEQWLSQQKVEIRTHHGFHWQGLRRRVWSKEADCLVKANSVHPPQTKDQISQIWQQKAEKGEYQHLLLETMYPGYCLGSSAEILWAMAIGLNLAVDVSHIYIQLCQGSLDLPTWQKLQNYEKIGEFHVSANHGVGDIHRPIAKNSFGLDWVSDRTKNNKNLPVILESYMHRLSFTERQHQVKLLLQSD